MNQKIDVLVVEPGQEPRPTTVEDTPEAFQQTEFLARFAREEAERA